MLAGQVGVVTTNPTLYGRAVQLFTHSKAFHTITALDDETCVSAEMPFVVRRPISDFENVLWLDIPMTEEQVNLAVAFVDAAVGKPYAYFDIELLAVAELLKSHTPKWIETRVADGRQWFCSELGEAGYEAAGIKLFPGIPACMVTPADFLNVVKVPA